MKKVVDFFRIFCDTIKDENNGTKKERVQNFEGVVIRRRAGNSLDATFTVRKVSNGIGVERIFPLHSPMISKINVKRRGKVRRAKLNYVRDISGSKGTRIKEKRYQ